jgi:integrase
MARSDSNSRKRRGITERRNADGSRTYLAEAYDRVTGKRKYKSFPTRAAAEKWRRETQVALATGKTRHVEPVALRDAWQRWLDLVDDGTIRTRSGRPYKPSVLRSYVTSFDVVWLKQLGGAKLGELRLPHVQQVVDRLVTDGAAAQTVRNHVNALRVLYRWAIRDELAFGNPCDKLALPTGGETRDRIATPTEAAALIAALPRELDRALWGLAFYAGLRRGELQALDRSNVDLAAGVIRVVASWDQLEGVTAPKSKAGVRTVPIPAALRPLLAEAVLSCAWPDGLFLGRQRDVAFLPGSVYRRARNAWKAAELASIGLHECRHTYASLLIAAGVNIKTIQTYMGHSSITTTLDRYGHLLPGSEREATALLDSYLAAAG